MPDQTVDITEARSILFFKSWQTILYNFLFGGKRIVCASLISITRLSAKILFLGLFFFFFLMLFFAAAYAGARKTKLKEGVGGSEGQQMRASFSGWEEIS